MILKTFEFDVENTRTNILISQNLLVLLITYLNTKSYRIECDTFTFHFHVDWTEIAFNVLSVLAIYNLNPSLENSESL